jgi:hypothetical protein
MWLKAKQNKNHSLKPSKNRTDYISIYRMLSLPILNICGMEKLTGGLPMSSKGREKSHGLHWL